MEEKIKKAQALNDHERRLVLVEWHLKGLLLQASLSKKPRGVYWTRRIRKAERYLLELWGKRGKL